MCDTPTLTERIRALASNTMDASYIPKKASRSSAAVADWDGVSTTEFDQQRAAQYKSTDSLVACSRPPRHRHRAFTTSSNRMCCSAVQQQLPSKSLRQRLARL